MCLAPQSKLRDGLGHLSFTESSAWGHVTTDIEAETAQARASTIDMSVSSLDIQRVEFVKIDAEGSEWAILKGAADTIKRFPTAYPGALENEKNSAFKPWKVGQQGPQETCEKRPGEKEFLLQSAGVFPRTGAGVNRAGE